MIRFMLSRARARTVFLGVLAVLTAPQSWGLGLGEIELNSALNQEFSATIELFDASGLEPGEIIVSLGSSEDFDRIGVERFFFLTDLAFQVDMSGAGGPVIQVTSRRPITEPYLNFLVEVLWPSGRLLKEYTVLLDPPTFSEASAPVVSAPAQDRTASSTGRVQRVEPARSGTRVQTRPAQAPAQPSALDQGFTGDEYGMTDRDDTLWTIASRVRPSDSVSVQQTMLAIQRMNPEAFINGNINLLKAGYVLRLPDEAQTRALSAADAIAQVAEHDADWRAYNRGDRTSRPAAAVAATTPELRSTVDASDTTTPAADVPASDGELRIVAEDGDSITGVGGQVAAAELDAVLEETDRLGRQVDELSYQLDREKELASNEIAVRERQIEVKDQQIAELQAQLAAARQAAQQIPPAGPQPDTQSQNQSSQAQVTTPWWQSPVVMYGGAGVLVLLLVGGMISARKRRAAAEEDDYFDAEEAFAEEERLEPALGETFEEELEEERGVAAHALDEKSEPEEELEGSQTSDVIGEADIYIAYGRYPQAIGLLLGVLEDEPERNDVRMKLLEVYAETADRSAFDQHMTALLEYCDDEEALLSARDLEGQFGEEAISLDDMVAGNEVAEAEDEEEVADLEFSSELDEPAQEAAPVEDRSGALDFELELDDIDTAAMAETDLETDDALEAEDEEDGGAGDQLGGDLGIDFRAEEEDLEALDDIEFEAAAPEEEDVDEAERRPAFAATEELTIDDELEHAAASISSEAAELEAETELAGDLAVETATEELGQEEEDLLDDLEFETVGESDEEFEFQDEGDSANTKLDLARAYIDMGDADGARDILKEVLDEGNSDQQQKAQSMLEAL